MSLILWRPSEERVNASVMAAFMRSVGVGDRGSELDYGALYRWSIEQPEEYWRAIWSFADVLSENQGRVVLENGDRMPGARWFPEARLNFAENLLRRRDHADAIVFRGEDRVQRRVSFADLYDQVSRVAQALHDAGVRPGDRVAAFMPNMPETVIAMLAAASLGAIWSSCSPDFGTRGLLDRFGQIEPKVLFAADGYFYNGKAHDCLARLAEVQGSLACLETLVVVPYSRTNPDLDGLAGARRWEELIAPYRPGEISFEKLPFDHPLYILFSSGTTGPPKCIVHGAGGTLLQHLKELMLHTDVRSDDRLFYFTTCGWMMWNWLVSALAARACLVLYDGSPFHPSAGALFDYADAEGVTIFGTSAKFIDAVKNEGMEPRVTHELAPLKTILSTGSPLVPESFDFVYRNVKPDVCLSSISGGTDIISCFALGNPILPVRRGELQCRGLGMKVEVWNDAGESVRGEKGELVCTAPFPSMPIGFWNDPDGSRYRSAYFERFPNVWHHGDYVELTESDGLIIYGRSDAVLNPGGVRIGTAEIYRQVEQLPEISEALAIGQECGGDVRIVLFVCLRGDRKLDAQLTARIKARIRSNATPRHVPAKIVQVTDLPHTKSGKLAELAVRHVVHGRPVPNRDALANPEALDQFVDLPELAASP